MRKPRQPLGPKLFESEPYKAFLNMQPTARTRTAYECDMRVLRNFLGTRSPLEATTKNMSEFLKSLEVYSPASASHIRTVVKKFYSHYMRRGQLKLDPTFVFEESKARKPIRVPKALPKEWRVKLIKSLKFDTVTNIQISLVVMFAFYCGLRRSEIQFLKWENINFNEKTLTVIGKGNKEAVLPICEVLMVRLAEYHAMTEWNQLRTEGKWIWVFQANSGKPISSQTVYDWTIKAGREWAGIPKEIPYYVHINRHSYVTELCDQMAPEDVQMLARHSSISTTLQYNSRDKQRSLDGYKKVFG